MGALQEVRALLHFRIMQLLALAGLIAAVGGAALRGKYCVLDPDIWWHMKVGDWVLEHLAVPHTGLFSQTAGQRPWTAYSWGYEVLLSRSYAWFGLVGIGYFGVLLTVLVAAVLFAVLLRISGRFWTAWVLTAIGCYAFLFSLMPRPVFFSMAAFAAELGVLLIAQRTRNVRLLYWVPLIFIPWANVHIQFTYGLALLGLFVGINVLQWLLARLKISFLQEHFELESLPLLPLATVFVACFVASCIGPYSYHLYGVLLEYSKAKITYAIIVELQSLDFQTPSHFCELLLTGAAFMAVGWQKKIDLFKLSLMIVATVVAFRTTRDAWFVCVPAVVFLADAMRTEVRDFRLKPLEGVGVFAVFAVVLFLIAGNTDFTNRGLDRAISDWYPVDAVNFLRRNPLPGPMYNSFDWGGFLIWYAPQYPVSIDGRNDLYGDEMDGLLYKSESGQPSYKDDPYLNEAGVVLLRKNVPLAKFLTVDKRFRVVYQDGIAAVFVRRDAGE